MALQGFTAPEEPRYSRGDCPPPGAIAAQGNPRHPAHGLAVPRVVPAALPRPAPLLAFGTEPTVMGFLMPVPHQKVPQSDSNRLNQAKGVSATNTEVP